jgi:hypothetical protein
VINNAATSTPEYVMNDKKFIASVYPTVTSGYIQIQTGAASGIKNLDIRVIDMNGRTVYTNKRNYGNGSIDLSRLAIGIYSIEIISDNRKYKHVQKIIRE